MRTRFGNVVIGLATAAAVAVLSMTVTSIAAQAPAVGQVPTPGQFPPYRAPRTADGKADLNGIWEALVTANIDVQDHQAQGGPRPELMGAYGAWPAGQGIVEGGEIPYRPEALAKKKQNVDNRMIAKIYSDDRRHDTGDPELKCFRPGLPRANYMPYPFQIIQSPKDIMIAYEYAHALRTIYMDDQKKAPADSWEGGRTGAGTATRWSSTRRGSFPIPGSTGPNYHSDALHVVERYTPVSPYHLMYEATIEDPKVFTRPWKMSFPLYRRMEKNVQLLDFNCVEFVEAMLYGRFRKPSTK
jgi:hypothetical protein